MSQVVVVIGGAPLVPAVTQLIEAQALVIAADSGLDHALGAGLIPHQLVGDMDSISDAGLVWARGNGVAIETHPRDKDLTDTALALQRAGESGHDHLLVLGGAGDRLDHTLGTIVALGEAANRRFASIEARLGHARIHMVFPGHHLQLDAPPDTSFSLLPLHGDCHGITVTGCRWPLDGADLAVGSTRGLSNVTIDEATVTLAPHPPSINPLTVIYS